AASPIAAQPAAPMGHLQNGWALRVRCGPNCPLGRARVGIAEAYNAVDWHVFAVIPAENRFHGGCGDADGSGEPARISDWIMACRLAGGGPRAAIRLAAAPARRRPLRTARTGAEHRRADPAGAEGADAAILAAGRGAAAGAGCRRPDRASRSGRAGLKRALRARHARDQRRAALADLFEQAGAAARHAAPGERGKDRVADL